MLVSHKTDVLGTILVFLPGYHDIVALTERMIAEERRLTEAHNCILYILHSNMEVRGGFFKDSCLYHMNFFGTCDTLWYSESLQARQYCEQILVGCDFLCYPDQPLRHTHLPVI